MSVRLADLLTVKVRESGTKVVVPKSQFVNPMATVPLGIVKPFEKELFPPDAKPTKIDREVTTKPQFNAWLAGFLSRNPHLEYIQSTLSGWFSERKYWFFDKNRNVKIVMTYDDIKRIIKY